MGLKQRVRRVVGGPDHSAELASIQRQLADLDHRWQDLNHKLSVVIDNRIDSISWKVHDALDTHLAAVRRELDERLVEVETLKARLARLEERSAGH